MCATFGEVVCHADRRDGGFDPGQLDYVVGQSYDVRRLVTYPLVKGISSQTIGDVVSSTSCAPAATAASIADRDLPLVAMEPGLPGDLEHAVVDAHRPDEEADGSAVYTRSVSGT